MRSGLLCTLSSLTGVCFAIGLMGLLDALNVHINSLYFEIRLTPAVVLSPLSSVSLLLVLASLGASRAAATGLFLWRL